MKIKNQKTDCIRQCKLKDNICLGCNRHIDEIIKKGNEARNKKLDNVKN